MDERLLRLVRDYQQKVAQAVAMLEAAGIARPTSDTAWANRDFPSRGPMPGGFSFYPHGFGCAVHCSDWVVDFDFGAAGEIDGFDVGKLCSFARKRLVEYGFKSENDIALAVRHAAENNDLRSSGYLLYDLRERHGGEGGS